MNAERLLALATLLDTIPAGAFDLRDWDCGTTACAIGHACRDPEFQKLGLGRRALTMRKGEFEPVFGKLTGWAAIDAFFGIARAEGYYLFDVNSYRDAAATPPRKVADRIRAFVALDGDI